MMHPHTRVQPISTQIGVGVVTTRPIPAATCVYQTDALDLRLAPDDPRLADPVLAQHIETYSYLDPDATRVVCWDIGKYVNHACTPNTLTTGYGFQIALRDLAEGEEITDDYGIYTDAFGPLICNEPTCRGHIYSSDFRKLVPGWDAQIKPALKTFFDVDQPLMHLLAADVLADLRTFVKTGKRYRSIALARDPETLPADVQTPRPRVTLNGNGQSHRSGRATKLGV